MYERCLLRIVAVLMLVAVGVRAEEPPESTSGPASGSRDGTQTQWARPEPIPPSAPSVPAKARLDPAPVSRSHSGPYLTLRALSTKEGEAHLQTAEGPRALRPGDHLGTDVVKAVGEGLLVLFRPATPGRPGSDATVVIRFDAAGQPSVRTYHTEDPTRPQQPEAQ